MSKPYPAVTKDFGDSFGESPSFQRQRDGTPRAVHTYDDEYNDTDIKKEIPTMSHTETKLSRTDILANALAGAQPRPTRSTHVKLLSEDEWRMVHEARKAVPKTGLAQLFVSMQLNYLDNDEAFFKSYAQFYNSYRQAAKMYNLPLIKRSKV